MKKVFPLLSTSTGAPLTGRQITLVRVFPDDGAEVACSELAALGTYLASSINPGLYKVFDRTGGAIPGTDLDQVVDVAAAILMQPSLEDAASGFLAAPGKTFRAILKSDVTGLAADLGALETSVSNAGAAILAEANVRLSEDAKIKTDLLKSVSDLTSSLIYDVNLAISSLEKTGYDVTVHLNHQFNGSNPDFAASTFRSPGQQGPMLFTAVNVQYMPDDIIPEKVFARFESPNMPSVMNNSYWYQPEGLSSSLLTATPAMPSLGITERIKNIEWKIINGVSGTSRQLFLALRVCQTKDFDHSLNLDIDVSDAGLLSSQFANAFVLIYDGTNQLCSRISIDVPDMFHTVKSKYLFRIKRSAGVLYCGSSRQFPFLIGA